ncbi:MAG: polyprenyl synthetase family protein [Lachnospiraceae bacterium]|nr:polyprenyl synthetase family protein [Lachnospiraceae bacterium]
MASDGFKSLLKEKTSEAEKTVLSFLPEESGFQRDVAEAVNYGVRSGGKRLRPILMKEAFLMYGGQDPAIDAFMAAIEFIHNYSLIHDDLEAMDNDEYRRGIKTTHAVYGEGMGVLAGDALLNLVYEITSSQVMDSPDMETMKRRALAQHILADKAGINGMVGGQSADLSAEKRGEASEELLLFMDEKKTACLMEASLMAGAALAGASEDDIRSMEECGSAMGIAFQIRDDILDVTGSREEIGKDAGSDEKNGKMTYVSVYGLEECRRKVEELTDKALSILKDAGGDPGFLSDLIASLSGRSK